MPPNVKYELQYYERLIKSVSKLLPSGGITRQGKTIASNIRDEADRIKQSFIQEVFNFQDERHLERYMQYHQLALIRLMDATLEHLNEENSALRDIYQVCFNGLEDLLSFVERHFTKYFDQDAKAPIAYVVIIRNDIRSNLVSLSQKLNNMNSDPKLVEGILYALRKIAEDDRPRKISYRKVLYVKELQKELTSLLNRLDDKSGINDELRNLLYYLNYNSIKTFAYHTNYIDDLLNDTDSRMDRIDRLSFLLKKINQAQVKPGIAYNTQAPPLKLQLNSYIIEEIEHLQRTHQLGENGASRSMVDLSASYRIQFEISVAQIALLIKLMVEAKVIANRNITELLRFISRVLVSKRVESISYDSLRSKYYNVEQSTKDAIKATLIRMTNLIDGVN